MWFRKKNKELEKIRAEFDCGTADYHGEDIWDLSEFLMLLNLADHEKMGKSKAVICAYKIGFLDGKQSTLDKIEKYLSDGAKNK